MTAEEDPVSPQEDEVSEAADDAERIIVSRGSDAGSPREANDRTPLIFRKPAILSLPHSLHIESEQFQKVMSDLSDFGTSMELRGRETIYLQAAQLYRVIRAVNGTYEEVACFWNHFKEHLTKAHDQNEDFQETLQARLNLLDSKNDELSNLQATMCGDFEGKLAESMQLCKRTVDKIVKNLAFVQDKKHEDLDSRVQQLDEVKDQHAKAIQGLEDRLAQLDSDLVEHMRRVKDEHRRLDNTITLAERALRDTKDNSEQASSKALRQDLEGVAKVVQSLATEVRELKAFPAAECGNAVFERTVSAESEGSGKRFGGGGAGTAGSHRDSAAESADGQFSRQVSHLLSPAGQPVAGGILDSMQENRNVRGLFDSPKAFRRQQTPDDFALSRQVSEKPEDAGNVLLSSEDIGNIKKRVDQVELVERELLKTFENLERRVNQIYNQTVSMSGLRKDFDHLHGKMKEFQTEMSCAVDKVQTVEMSHAIANFRARWDLFASKITPRQVFGSWRQFLAQRQRFRDAMSKTKELYSKRHAGVRLQSWYYITQRAFSQRGLRDVEERALTMQSQQEALAATVAKRERIATEQAKDLHCRISMVEKRLEVHSAKKADNDHVQDLVSALQKRYEREVDPAAQKKAIQELRESVDELEQSKTNTVVSERHGNMLRDLAQEMRANFIRHDDIIETKASKADNSRKANAQIVEQTVLLLARQADHLATLVSDDLELIRGIIGRFLELSPDIRKAALSLGLESNDRCMACRATDRKMVIAPLLGTDNTHYRLSSETLANSEDQTRKIVQDTLRFPSHLTSSLVAGKTLGSAFGEQWQPIEQPGGAEAPPSGRPPVKPAAPRELSASEPQVLLGRLRKLIQQEPGWIACAPADGAGTPCGRGSPQPATSRRRGASPKRTFLVEDEAQTGSNMPTSGRLAQSEKEAMPSITRPNNSRPATAGSGAGRPPVSAKTYFRRAVSSLDRAEQAKLA